MRSPQACSSRSRPSVPRNPSSFSSLQRAQPSLPRAQVQTPIRRGMSFPPTSPAPAHLRFNVALACWAPSHLPHTSSTSLTSRRCRWHCASPRIGHCGFRLTQATRPRCQVCQGRKMGPESPSPGVPNTAVVASVISLPPSPPGSLGPERPGLP